MDIHLSTNDGVPIYQQITAQVKYMVAAGRLKPGEELPPIRKLAENLIVNPNTVARAYRELEREGIIEARRGAGTVVTAKGSPLSDSEKARILSERADALLSEARQMDVSFADLVELLKERNAAMKADQRETS